MLRNAILAAAISSLFVCSSTGASAALVCPVPAPGADAGQGPVIAAAISGNALADGPKVSAAIDALRAKGIGNAVIVDSLISAYCPRVAANAALNDEQKRAQVRRFAARVTRLVYALDSVDAVILDVPLRPDVVDAINARAASEKVSPEAWVANAVDRALKAPR